MKYLYLVLALLFFSCSSPPPTGSLKDSEGGYDYVSVPDDKMNTRIYTLKNGLKVYLSNYDDAPRAHVLIPIRAGGKNDPSDNTGLAHYLEHMMFKGTADFGTLDYASEKVLLDSIEMMFNHYASLTDSMERKVYYQKIDEISHRAAEFAIPNEFDQIISTLGAKEVNAYTSFDETVYTLDIPSNELNRYLKLEGNRFKTIVNRLFHTELETVYEEKNRKSDGFSAYQSILQQLFPSHPYGTQSIIGTIDHLKNPSITAIKKYFNNYYRPNNAAICISGDIDYTETIQLIDQYFGDWVPNEDLTPWDRKELKPKTHVSTDTIYGPEREFIYLGYKFDGRDSKDYILLSLLDMILNNAQAGLIDINLKQGQKVLSAGSFPYSLTDHSIHFLYGYPREGQTLDEVKNLILEQIELVKEGKFEDWLIDAVIVDFKKNRMKELEENKSRASNMKDAFVNGIPWEQYVHEIDEFEKVTKEEIIEFAKEKYKDNYALVYKKTGEDPNKQIVEKPSITKIELNREVQSDFHIDIDSMPTKKLEPVFIDFEREISHTEANGIKVHSKVNQENELFQISFLYEFGSNDYPLIDITSEYVDYIGTSSYSAEEFKKEMYKLGCELKISASDKRTTIKISGIDEKMEGAIQLVERLLSQPEVNQGTLDKLIQRNLKSRKDAKKDKEVILFQALSSYMKYGPKNPFNNILSNESLEKVQAKELAQVIQNFASWPHEILYYGPKTPTSITGFIEKHHKTGKARLPLPDQVKFEMKSSEQKVYWTHFDIKQSEIVFLHRNGTFDPTISSQVSLFNQYFGGGMNSIVFQEIREAQALAYSVTSRYQQAARKDEHDYVFAYIGTQADKQAEAMAGMFKLINDMPESENSFDIAKQNILNQIESERITKNDVLWNYVSSRDKGITYDLRQDVYREAKTMSFEDVKSFQQMYMKNKAYDIVLIGDKEQIDIDNLQEYGQVKELSLEELFGY